MKSMFGKVLMAVTVSSLVLGGGAQSYALMFENGGFEGLTSIPGPAQPADQTWWVKDGSGGLGTDYATWSIASGAGIGGSDCAVATPGLLAQGNSENYRVGLRQYYLDVDPNTTYTIGFSYKAVGQGFQGITGNGGAADESWMSLVVLESASASGGSWSWGTANNPGMNIGDQALDWTYASYTFTTLATTESIGVKFGILFGTDAAGSSTDKFYLDNVTPSTSVPDGGMTMTLLGLGMAGLGLLRRKLS